MTGFTSSSPGGGGTGSGTGDRKHANVCPRLIDYLAIVGTRNYSGVTSRHAASVQPPELLRRYPPTDHKVRRDDDSY